MMKKDNPILKAARVQTEQVEQEVFADDFSPKPKYVAFGEDEEPPLVPAEIEEDKGGFVQKSYLRSEEAWARGLSGREMQFVLTYFETGNYSESVRAAGYDLADLTQKARNLMKKKSIHDALVHLRAKAIRSLSIDPEDITRALASMAFARVEDFLDENGNILPPHLMPDTTPIQSIEMTDTKYGRKVKITLVDKLKATEDLAKAVGYFEGHEKAKRPMQINLNGLSMIELRKLANMKGDEKVELPV